MVHHNGHQSGLLRTGIALTITNMNVLSWNKHCNPSTSPIMTVEYDVIESTVVPDPGARTRI